MSRDAGADIVIDARMGKESVVQEVNKATNNQGADATICVADHDFASGLACAVTKMHGTMVQIAQVHVHTIRRINSTLTFFAA